MLNVLNSKTANDLVIEELFKIIDFNNLKIDFISDNMFIGYKVVDKVSNNTVRNLMYLSSLEYLNYLKIAIERIGCKLENIEIINGENVQYKLIYSKK